MSTLFRRKFSEKNRQLEKNVSRNPAVSIFSMAKAKRSPQHNFYEESRPSQPPPPPPPEQAPMFRSMGSFPASANSGLATNPLATNPLASVLGAINAPPPPPPPSEPPYSRYQHPPPPPPPDDYGYASYQPPPPQFPGGPGHFGSYGPPPGGSYGNYSSFPPQSYGANPGPPPDPRNLAYLGANQPPAANPLFKHMGYGEGNF